MKSRLIMLLACLYLVGCSNNSTNSERKDNSSVSEIEKVELVSDEELAKYEKMTPLFDNKMKMEAIGGSIESPDPFIYRFNGYYYLYQTTGGRKIKAYKSIDLINWEAVDNKTLPRGYVYDYFTDGSLAPQSPTPYAPEVIYFNGNFYMIISPSGDGHYILQGESPDGPFTCISENLQHSIDGSFFIDDDEEVYVYGASSSIKAYKLKDDFSSFDENIDVGLSQCQLGGWNEGPYMLRRNGCYYLTYCGSHYMSSDYRVDYAYIKENSDVLKSSSYKRMSNILVSTKDDFQGLGHSCSVLGPDMDSYYMAYHNLEPTNQRYFNLSRLSFNGSSMLVDSVGTTNNLSPRMPIYSTYDDTNFETIDNYLLSGEETNEVFTCEFNCIGEGKMIFSYKDKNNYSFIEFKNNTISICKLEDSKIEIIKEMKLIKEYSTSVIHTYRLQYSQGMMNFYFDSMEKAYNVPCNFSKGKIGYEKGFSYIGYTAFSDVALGSSDNRHYHNEKSFANAYDFRLSYLNKGSGLVQSKGGSYLNEDSNYMLLKNKEDRATYRTYQKIDGTYSLNMRFAANSLKSKIGIKVDNKPMKEVTLNYEKGKFKNGDCLVPVTDLELSQGFHNISIYNIGDEIQFSELHYSLKKGSKNKSYQFGSITEEQQKDFLIQNPLEIENQELLCKEGNLMAMVSKEEFQNSQVKLNFEVQDMAPYGYVSVLLNVSNYALKKHSSEGLNATGRFAGYKLNVFKDAIKLEYVDYNHSTTLAYKSYNFETNKKSSIKIIQNNNTYLCYLNDSLIFEYVSNYGNLSGSVGTMVYDVNCKITSLEIN